MIFAGVGESAQEVVKEVRRRFRENPEIMTYQVEPERASILNHLFQDTPTANVESQIESEGSIGKVSGETHQ